MNVDYLDGLEIMTNQCTDLYDELVHDDSMNEGTIQALEIMSFRLMQSVHLFRTELFGRNQTNDSSCDYAGQLKAITQTLITIRKELQEQKTLDEATKTAVTNRLFEAAYLAQNAQYRLQESLTGSEE